VGEEAQAWPERAGKEWQMSERIKQREDEKACESCEYPAKILTPYRHRRNYGRSDVTEESKTILLCELCASTVAGTATQYPDQFPSEIHTLQTLCFIGNAILDALPVSHEIAHPDPSAQERKGK
jgi:hypothetical protein